MRGQGHYEQSRPQPWEEPAAGSAGHMTLGGRGQARSSAHAHQASRQGCTWPRPGSATAAGHAATTGLGAHLARSKAKKGSSSSKTPGSNSRKLRHCCRGKRGRETPCVLEPEPGDRPATPPDAPTSALHGYPGWAKHCVRKMTCCIFNSSVKFTVVFYFCFN